MCSICGEQVKHILIVSQYFYPEVFRINDIAMEWVKRGYKVTVLTGIPNYPTGKFFEGYSWTKHKREKWNGIDIIRIPLVPRGNNPIQLVINYYSFLLSGWFWNRFNNIDADLVFSYETSPMTQVVVGCGYAKKHHTPHFVYVQDLWPENIETVLGIHNRIVIGPINRMVDRIYKQADQIFVTSPSFVKSVTDRKNRVDPSKVHYWPQYAEEFYKPMKPQLTTGIDAGDGCLKIAFTGNIGTAQGLDVLPNAAKLLKGKRIKFIVVGNGRYQQTFESLIHQLNVEDMFTLLPRVPAEEIPKILSVCDAGFISFANTPLWEKTIPAKLQSYMACGKAIIASASGETERIVKEARCGICTRVGDADALAQGIVELTSEDCIKMGHNAKMYFDSHFDKKTLMDEMDVYLNTV